MRSKVFLNSKRVLEPWTHRWQTDARVFTTQDLDEVFAKISNTSVRFRVLANQVDMVEDPSSVILDRGRAGFFKDVFASVHQKLGLPPGLDFVVNLHDEPLFPQALANIMQPPIFSFCPGIAFADIPMVNDNIVKLDTSLATQTRESFDWSSRLGTAFWRGSTTGGWYTIDNWSYFPRTVLTKLSREFPSLLDAAFVRCAQCEGRVWEAIQGEGLSQQEESYPTANDLRRHKFLIDIDGNACSFRFLSLLGHGAVVFKVQPNYTEFFDPFLVPYIHYIPVKSDMSDLVEKLEWAHHHDDEMEKIAIAALNMYELMTENRLWEEWIQQVLSSYHILFTKLGSPTYARLASPRKFFLD